MIRVRSICKKNCQTQVILFARPTKEGDPWHLKTNFMNLAFLFARPAQEENLENLHCQTWPSFLQGRLRRMIWSICKKDYQTRPSSLQVWLRMMIRSLWKRIEWTWLSLCKTSSGGGSGKFALLNMTILFARPAFEDDLEHWQKRLSNLTVLFARLAQEGDP